jgi:hypothetical protein
LRWLVVGHSRRTGVQPKRRSAWDRLPGFPHEDGDNNAFVRHRLNHQEHHMEKTETIVAVFEDHASAESAVKKLAASGFEMKNLSVVGKGCQTEEKAIGFYNIGDRMKFWGARGAFWGGLWGLFFGGLFLAVPVVGHVVVLGYLATVLIGAIENAVVVGGLSALGAAIYGLGIPKDSVVQYETALKADRFLVMAHGSAADMTRAKAILGTVNPSRLDVHVGSKPKEAAGHLVPAGE